ncbi:MAG TPA: hypothetical protein VGB18_01440, partial [Candidatus Thermoplasmatota archaeon]
MHVEVAGKHTNSAEEVVARLVDYGPVSMLLVLVATFVGVAPYPAAIRWAVPVLVGLFVFGYQYLVATDLRRPRVGQAISVRWFAFGFLAGFIGFWSTLSLADTFQIAAVQRWGVLGWIPVQLAAALMMFQTGQGLRGRH